MPHASAEGRPPALPDRALVTLCEVVTWLATGDSQPAATLRQLLKRHQGARRPVHRWRRWETAADTVIETLRRGDIVAYGQLDDGPHEAVPRDYFMSDAFIDFATDSIAPDPLAWEAGTYPERLATYRNVRFWKSDVEQALRHAAGQPQQDPPRRRATVAAGSRCRDWLIGLMKSGPQEQAKIRYQEHAVATYGISTRQFKSAWDQARQEVGNPQWGRPGPKPSRSPP